MKQAVLLETVSGFSDNTNLFRAAIVFRLFSSVAMTTTLEKASFGAGW
jgi:hypothetical protein